MIDVQQITGTPKSVSVLLSDRYGLDFYQREYSWGNTQVAELVEDLATRFLDEFDPSHERRQVAAYRPYFLGPIMTAYKDGKHFIVDGQQRITTLSLFVMHLRHALVEEGCVDYDLKILDNLIYSSKYGERTYQLDVDERTRCLDAIFFKRGGFAIENEHNESVRNIWRQFETIKERFPDDLQDSAVLPYFSDWLLDRVVLIHVIAPDQHMALEIFETMNDRGLRLNNIDMLKSHLLARVDNDDTIRKLNIEWRSRVTELADIEKNADAEFVKVWLRGHYAETQRERKAKAAPLDFDIIGTAFHRWVRDNSQTIIGLNAGDYHKFVGEFFDLSRRYKELLNASRKYTSGFESVYHNAQAGFTLQLLVIMAAVCRDDDDDTFRRKAALVAKALDIFLVRRMVNNRNSGYSTVQYTIFNLAKSVRRKSPADIQAELMRWLDAEKESLDGMERFSLTQNNRSRVRYILARITSWLDGEFGENRTFVDYMDRSRKHPYEVEHVLADKFDRHESEFDNEDDFQRSRNRIGGLVLLPKDKNTSYGAMPYGEKVRYYSSENILARSLCADAYERDPEFRRLRERVLGFKSYESFGEGEISDRSKLYKELAEIVWDPNQLSRA